MAKTTVHVLATLACLAYSTVTFAQEAADSRASYTIGVRAWNAAWSTALPTAYTGVSPDGAPALAESLDNVHGKRRTEAFPSIAVRKDKFVISASYARFSSDFYAANTSIIGPNGMNVVTSRSDHLDRKESDITAGYFIVPNVALSVGFKYGDEGRTATLGLGGAPRPVVDNTVRSLLFGAAAAFPIQGNLLFTGQIAYGPARVKTQYADNLIPTTTNSGRYLISEIGVAYALGVKNAYFRSASIGLGYRTQVLKTKASGPSGLGGRNYRDERDGLIATLNFTI